MVSGVSLARNGDPNAFGQRALLGGLQCCPPRQDAPDVLAVNSGRQSSSNGRAPLLTNASRKSGPAYRTVEFLADVLAIYYKNGCAHAGIFSAGGAVVGEFDHATSLAIVASNGHGIKPARQKMAVRGVVPRRNRSTLSGPPTRAEFCYVSVRADRGERERSGPGFHGAGGMSLLRLKSNGGGDSRTGGRGVQAALANSDFELVLKLLAAGVVEGMPQPDAVRTSLLVCGLADEERYLGLGGGSRQTGWWPPAAEGARCVTASTFPG